MACFAAAMLRLLMPPSDTACHPGQGLGLRVQGLRLKVYGENQLYGSGHFGLRTAGYLLRAEGD